MAKGFNWTPRRVALLGTDSDLAIAKRLGVSRLIVQRARTARGIRSGEKHRYKSKEITEITRAIEKLAKKLRRQPKSLAIKIRDMYFY